MKQNDTRFLNGMRFILALWVALGHFYKYLGGEAFIKIKFIGTIILNNGVAVDGFMIITGFLMTYHYLLREHKEPVNTASTFYKFWTRRFFRLYPLYFITLIIAFAVFNFNYNWVYENYAFFSGKAAHFNTTYSAANLPGFKDLFYHLTFLHGLIPFVNTSILGPAWSLSLEIQYYLLFPFIFIIFFNPKNRARNFNIILLILIISAVVLSILSVKWLGNWDTPGKYMALGAPSIITYKIQFFVLGMLMASVLLKAIKPHYLVICILLILPFVNILTAIIMLSINAMMFVDNWDFLGSVIIAPINFVKRLFSGRFSDFGADISYSFYLIHMIIMPGVLKLVSSVSTFNKHYTAALALVLFLLITGSISYILFLIVEKSFIKLGKKVVDKK